MTAPRKARAIRAVADAAAPGGVTSRIAELETELASARAKSAQMERLRKFGTWELDLDTSTLTWSDGTYRIFELSPSRPITLEGALAFYPDEAKAQIAAAVEAAMAETKPYDLTVRFLSAGGRTGWIRTMGQLETEGRRRRLVGIVEDVTDDVACERTLKDMAFLDALTGLPNRRSFQASLDALASRQGIGGSVALLLLDVDNFKIINDTHGHPVGDEVLCEVARRLRSAVTGRDVVARLSGDEFALVLDPVEDGAQAERRAGALLGALRSPFGTEVGLVEVRASVGVAIETAGNTEGGTLFRRADIALYRAKASGRDRACLYRPEMHLALEEEASTLAAIRVALAEHQLVPFYQPIVDLRSGAVRGLESLVRWRHPARGTLSPAAFQAALMDPTLSVAIDDTVLEQALRQMRAWLDQGLAIPVVNVNVSNAQLKRPDLFERVTGLLAEYRLTPDRLKLEIVETALLGRGSDQIADTLDRLAAIGVVPVLDDFGTGYASLSHLRTFRIERIKIDRSFIAGVCQNPFDRGLVRSIVDLGRNLGIRVTAEGVETAEQLAILNDFGCDCAQGYLIGKPVAADDVPAALMNWYAKVGNLAIDATPRAGTGPRGRMRLASSRRPARAG